VLKKLKPIEPTAVHILPIRASPRDNSVYFRRDVQHIADVGVMCSRHLGVMTPPSRVVYVADLSNNMVSWCADRLRIKLIVSYSLKKMLPFYSRHAMVEWSCRTHAVTPMDRTAIPVRSITWSWLESPPSHTKLTHFLEQLISKRGDTNKVGKHALAKPTYGEALQLPYYRSCDVPNFSFLWRLSLEIFGTHERPA